MVFPRKRPQPTPELGPLPAGNDNTAPAFLMMPHYHFELANGHRIPDPRGLHCKDNEDAIAKAHQIANAMAVEVGDTRRCLVVVDDEGNDLCKVPIRPTGPPP